MRAGRPDDTSACVEDEYALVVADAKLNVDGNQ